MNEEEEEKPVISKPVFVSDEELIDHLRQFLRNSDLNTTTTAIVRRKLEEDFSVDLSNRKSFIRQQVDLFLQTQIEKPAGEDDDVEEEEEEVEEEEHKRKVKSESPEDEGSGEDEEVSSGEEISSNGKRRKKAV